MHPRRALAGVLFLATATGLSIAFAQVKPPSPPPGLRPNPTIQVPVKPAPKPPEGVRSGRIQCRGGGDMAARLVRIESGADAGKWSMSLDFKGGSARNLAPGECGFDGGPFAPEGLFEGMGRLEFVTALAAPALTELEVKGNEVTGFTVNGTEMMMMLNAAVKGTRFYAAVSWTGRGGRTMPVIYKVDSVNH